jgi:hypothetical protein
METIGYLAGTITTMSLFPQIVRTYAEPIISGSFMGMVDRHAYGDAPMAFIRV